MITLTVCPSTLAEGFDTHSPAARKKMFDDKMVSHYLRVPSPSTTVKKPMKLYETRSESHCRAYSPSIR